MATKKELEILGFFYDRESDTYFRKDDLFSNSSYWYSLDEISVYKILIMLKEDWEKDALNSFKKNIRHLFTIE